MKLTKAALSQWWNRAGRSVAEQSALAELLNEPATGPQPTAPARMTTELRTAIRDRAAQIEHETRQQADADTPARGVRTSGPELTGGEPDREIDRLAHLYPEPGLSEPADPGRYLEAGQ